MGERLPCTEEVRGSSPLISTLAGKAFDGESGAIPSEMKRSERAEGTE